MIDRIDIKRVIAKNFVCFGEEGIDIDFTKYGPIVLILGENWDAETDDDNQKTLPGFALNSNGTGKSSIIDAVVYAMYGEVAKNPKKLGHANVINNRVGKKLHVELYVNDLKIVRTRKPDSLQIWQSATGVWDKTTEISKGGIPANQAWLDDYFRITFAAFMSVFPFTDNNANSFLECDAKTKRNIVENMIGLERYKTFHENAKTLRNKAKNLIKQMSTNFELKIAELESAKRRIVKIQEQENEWKNNQKTIIARLNLELAEKIEAFNTSDYGSALKIYEDAQARIVFLNESLPEKQSKVDLTAKKIAEAEKKLDVTRSEKNTLHASVDALEQEISTYKNKIASNTTLVKNLKEKTKSAGSRCGNCFGVIDEKNFESSILQCQNIIDSSTKDMALAEEKKAPLAKQLAQKNDFIKKLNQFISELLNEQREVSNEISQIQKELAKLSKVQRPEISVNEKLFEEQIEEFKRKISDKQDDLNGDSPYVTIMQSAIEEKDEKQVECDEKKNELLDAEKKLPYYDIWVAGFGDAGIRKSVIEEMLPALNSQIQKRLGQLMDGRVKLSFNNELEETIERNPSTGDPFVYEAMSGGERRRLNLAVPQGMAYITMLNSGVVVSSTFLDEVASNMDSAGITSVYNMILELSKEKQVFVTTHDRELLELLKGFDTIRLRKQNGFTTLVS